MSDKPKAYSYVRLSTPEQLKGDSVRRQLKATDDYVRANNMELVEIMQDRGVSAFKGKNAELGELSRILDMISDGTIAEDSYLIVEAFDRLSRQNIMEAIALFSKIIQAGVNIVTLVDGKVYRRSSVGENSIDLIYAAIVMIRAHEESVTKSIRLSAAWENKRNIARSGKVTMHKLPQWLKYSDCGDAIEVIDDRADIIRMIFEMCRDGYGAYSVARFLNEKKIATWGRSKFWHESYVKKILDSRGVLGEYQPRKFAQSGNKQNRITAGEPIIGYYPRIIDDILFEQAAAAAVARKTTGQGRKGKHLSNLFTGLLKCSACGSGLRFIDKGPGPKGGQYLRCSAAQISQECSAYGARYQIIEDMLLKWIGSVNFETAVNRQKWENELQRLNEEKTELQKSYQMNKEKIKNLIDALAMAPSVIEIAEKLKAIQIQNEKIERDVKVIEEKIDDLGSQEIKDRSELINQIKIGHAGNLEEYAVIRRRVSTEIKKVIKEINCSIIPVENPNRAHTSVFLREPEIEINIKYRSGNWQSLHNLDDYSVSSINNERLRTWRQVKGI